MEFSIFRLIDPALMLAAIFASPALWSRIDFLRRRPWLRTAGTALLVAGIVVSATTWAVSPFPTAEQLVRGAALTWAILLLLAAGVSWIMLPRPATVDAGRRKTLATIAKTAMVAPVVATGYGFFVERLALRLEEVDIFYPGLPRDLDGLRIVHISDLHLGAYLGAADLQRVIGLANETKAHFAMVTGDLITHEGDPLDLALREIARIQVPGGVYGCHGNHEIYADAEEYASVEGARLGVKFLRGEAVTIPVGKAQLRVAGVDYQRKSRPYLVGTGKLVDPQLFNVLLCHNPDPFPIAASQGFDLTLAGHTHGGQVNVEILERNINLVRFMTPYTRGLYKKDNRAIFVNSGIGTVGVPVRLGAVPEVALIRLCSSCASST